MSDDELTIEPVEPGPDIAELKSMLAALGERMDALAGENNFWKQLVDKKQEHIDKLYEENRAYKEDLVEKFKRKLVLGVIEQLDVADKQIATFTDKEESAKNYQNLLSAFCEIAEEFREMLLHRLDIIPFCSDTGTPFDPTRQNALCRQTTSDLSRDQTIAKSRRHGYETSDGKILRPELVEVFCYAAIDTEVIAGTEQKGSALQTSDCDAV